MDPIIRQKMDTIAEEIFGTLKDPNQIPITNESREKLYKLTPNWIEYELDEKQNPISWVIIVPTDKKLAERFLNKEITEKELLNITTPQEKYSAIYLCAAVTVPEHRRKGLALKLFKKAIAKISKTNNFILFAWPTEKGGIELAQKIEKELNIKVQIRN